MILTKEFYKDDLALNVIYDRMLKKLLKIFN
jgi:hypothetical protein